MTPDAPPPGVLLTARWAFPVAAPPIEEGAVLVSGGRIAWVGRRHEAPAAATAHRWDLGEAAILPGLVNCHTHLELGGLGGVRAEGFVPWLLEVRAARQRCSLEAQAAAAAAGAQALLESGVTCVGEVSTSGQSLGALRRAGLRGVVYREVLGVDPGGAVELAEGARADLARMAAECGPLLTVGLSPHSAYALSEELLACCAGLAGRVGAPVCMHVAESADETAYLRTGDGAIPGRLYPAVGVPAPPRRVTGSPLAYLAALGVLPERSLAVHAVHVDEADLPWMAVQRLRVAHCPRSNARLSGAPAPVRAFLAHRIPVGLGTDSLASAPSLDLWEEMRAARAMSGLDAAAVLDMATRGGATALGLEAAVGSLEAGKQADVIAVSATAVRSRDPAGSLLDGAGPSSVLLVLIGGEPRLSRVEGTRRCA